MNRVLIFAGGKGTRMKLNDIPKQFLEINGKSIIIHTISRFEKCKDVDDVVVVCIAGWIDELNRQIKNNGLTKVSKVIAGGETGFDSRIIGLEYMDKTKQSDDDIILIHDGVRPIITLELISENIKCAKKNGNAITMANATETIIYTKNNPHQIINREYCLLARAPQTFKLKNIYNHYKKAVEDNKTDIIDSASLAYYYGEKLNYVIGPQENIKVTTAIDYYAVSGIMNSLDENMKIFK